MASPYAAALTDRAAIECARIGTLGVLERSEISQLLDRSGAKNVSNAILTKRRDHRAGATIYQVSFDSRAWTGR